MVGHQYYVDPAPMYRIDLGDSLSSLLRRKELTVRPNARVDALQRYKGRLPLSWPYLGSFTHSMYLYYRSLTMAGQTNVGRTLLGILHIISSRLKTNAYQGCEDDVVRQLLKLVSSWAFKRTFTHGLEYMLFVHLHNLGGKAPFNEDQIVSDITSWVSGGKGVDMEVFSKVLDTVMATWYRGEIGHLPFESYCNDVLRWGTSGGAPKSEWDGSDYRTKWAWGLSHITDPMGNIKDSSLYDEAVKTRPWATVALKEEPSKTREVIATGMASYLRQSYLMYRWGKPNLPSPISSSNWLPSFYDDSPVWYGCVDGERFDQSIPKEVVIMVLDRLGDLDAETRRVADMEIKDMEHLEVRWGKHSWTWRGGLLSGWRITSLIGSIVSHAVAEYICRKTNTIGSVRWGVMGDDLVLFSNSASIPSEVIVQEYEKFGLHANLSKTTSGMVGEFLRKTLSPRGILGYPALGCRSLVYANPWISSYTYSEELEVSQSWLTFFSRLLPHAVTIYALEKFIRTECVAQLCRFGNLEWGKWLNTPISAGGGGPMEWSRISDWCTIKKTPIRRDPKLVGVWLATTLGITKYKRALVNLPSLKDVNIRIAHDVKNDLVGATANYVPGFNHDINITETVLLYLSGKISTPALAKRLRHPLPRGLRVAPRKAIVSYLLGLSDEQTGLTSIQHTKETASKYSGLQQYVTRGVSISKRFNNLSMIGPAVTIYASQIFGNFTTVYGTW